MSCGGFPALLVFDAVRDVLSRRGEFCVVAPVLVDDKKFSRAGLLRRGGFRLAASRLANDDGCRWCSGQVVEAELWHSASRHRRWQVAVGGGGERRPKRGTRRNAANNMAINRALASLMPVT
jgi:hypothetical protein